MNSDRSPQRDKAHAAAQGHRWAPLNRPYRLLTLLLLGGFFSYAVWRNRQILWTLLRDEQALEAFIQRLGWLGPLALIAFNAAQIVIAPIPGYVVQAASGFLFGPFWGGVWGSIGLLVGSMLATWLARTFGRPLAERLIGDARLQRWETVTHSTSSLIWFILILSPTGDLPYFLAGLSSVRYRTIILLTLLIRVPTTFVVAAAGAGVMLLSWGQLVLAIVLLSGFLALFLRYQDQMLRWIDGNVQRLSVVQNKDQP